MRKYTWIQKTRCEIVSSALMDYVCISKKHKANVTDVNVLRAAGDIQSDHHLVVCKIKVKREWIPLRTTGEI